MKTRHPAITLVETLVVISVIGVLVALLLPAVQHVREIARKTTCQNNLRQLAVAIQNHETAQSSLPSLYYGSFLKQPSSVSDEFHFHSWRAAILPQLGQDGFYQQIDLSLPATDVANLANLNTSVSVFLCPSTSSINTVVPDILAFNNGMIPTKKIGTAARSDYEAVAGVHVEYLPTIRTEYGVWGEPEYDLATAIPISYRSARLRDVTDGLSTTLLVGERSGRPDWYRRGQPVDSYPYTPPIIDHHQAAWGISTHIAWLVFGHEQAINDTNATGIYSFHRSGANVALADGSVRFLSETVDQVSLNAMATRSAGDIVTLD